MWAAANQPMSQSEYANLFSVSYISETQDGAQTVDDVLCKV